MEQNKKKIILLSSIAFLGVFVFLASMTMTLPKDLQASATHSGFVDKITVPPAPPTDPVPVINPTIGKCRSCNMMTGPQILIVKIAALTTTQYPNWNKIGHPTSLKLQYRIMPTESTFSTNWITSGSQTPYPPGAIAVGGVPPPWGLPPVGGAFFYFNRPAQKTDGTYERIQVRVCNADETSVSISNLTSGDHWVVEP